MANNVGECRSINKSARTVPPSAGEQRDKRKQYLNPEPEPARSQSLVSILEDGCDLNNCISLAGLPPATL